MIFEWEASPRFEAALALYRKGQVDKAELICNSICTRDIKHFESIFLLACIQRRKGFLDKAISLFERAFEIRPNNISCLFNLGNSYRDKLEWKKSISYYRKALGMNNRDHDVLNEYGFWLNERGAFLEAKQVLVRCLELNPSNYLAWLNLGNTFQKEGEIKYSILSYYQGVKLKPDLIGFYFNLGVIFEEIGKYKQANKSYLLGIKLKPSFDDLFISYIRSLNELGDIDGAILFAKDLTDAFPSRMTYVSGISSLGPEFAAKVYECQYSNK